MYSMLGIDSYNRRCWGGVMIIGVLPSIDFEGVVTKKVLPKDEKLLRQFVEYLIYLIRHSCSSRK